MIVKLECKRRHKFGDGLRHFPSSQNSDCEALMQAGQRQNRQMLSIKQKSRL
jgi:hypothetical protein